MHGIFALLSQSTWLQACKPCLREGVKCVYIYIYIYIIYIYCHLQVHALTHICTCVYTSIYIYIYTSIYIFICSLLRVRCGAMYVLLKASTPASFDMITVLNYVSCFVPLVLSNPFPSLVFTSPYQLLGMFDITRWGGCT